MTTIIRRLERLRRRARAVLVVERTAVVTALVLALLCGWVALDAVVRFPMPIRVAALAFGAIALVLVLVRWWWPAIRFQPPLTELALRVERRRPELAGDLASSVEFQRHSPTPALEARTIERTERLVGDLRFDEIIRRDRVTRALVGLAAALVVPIAMIVSDPGFSGLGAKRALLPWMAGEWPARTMVESRMSEITHLPRGPAVLLRAEAVRGDPASMKPFVRYRLVRDGLPGPWKNATLARQEGGIFERPIDADADAIEYQFGTADATTELATIALVTPPAIRQAMLEATPPSYARDAVSTRRVELGPGTDARAVLATPLLAGSTVEIDFELTRPIPIPAVDPVGSVNAGGARDSWVRATFGSELPAGTEIVVEHADGGASTVTDRVRLRTTVESDLSMPIALRDEHGIAGDGGARYRLPVVPDRAPTVSVAEPTADEVVLETATLRLAAEARDDVRLDEIGLRIERAGDEPREQRSRADGENATSEWTLTPASVGAKAGDVLLVSAVATDGFEVDGVRRAPTISAPRRIRVVAEEEFTRQIRAQLASVRQSAIRAEATQREIRASAEPEEGEAAAAADQARRQSQLSDRIRSMRDAVAALEARARAGGLEREALGEIMRQAQDLLDAAGRASSEASVHLAEQASAESRRGPEGGEQSAQAQAAEQAIAAAQAASEAQEEARTELEDLVRLLDRDEDAWIATRKIERLAEELAKLLEETRRIGERTIGQDAASLSAEERLELERLAARDRAAANQAREALDELRDRAERLAKADRTRAAGMSEAARRGEERQVARRLDEASEQTTRNQPTNAEQSLREAAEAAQAMKEAIQDDRRSRVEELRRRLASVEESVRMLVTQAEESLADVREVAAQGDRPSSDLIDPVITKVVSLDRNIGSVTGEASSASGMERVARLLDRAGERSATAAARLRAEPPALEGSEDALDRSRGLLVEALELAQEQRRQADARQSEEKRRELADALRALSERQAGLRTASEPLVGATAGERRKLVEGRRLSVEQEVIRSAVEELRSNHEEIGTSELFDSAMGRLAGWMKSSAEQLSQTRVTARTLIEQGLAAETLAMMGQSLADRSANDDPFAEATAAAAEDDQSGGEGRQGGEERPAMPPIAELRLLRETQAQLARRTRLLDETPTDASVREAEIKDLARLQQELLEHGEAWVERLRAANRSGAPGARGSSPPVSPDPPRREGEGGQPRE